MIYVMLVFVDNLRGVLIHELRYVGLPLVAWQ